MSRRPHKHRKQAQAAGLPLKTAHPTHCSGRQKEYTPAQLEALRREEHQRWLEEQSLKPSNSVYMYSFGIGSPVGGKSQMDLEKKATYPEKIDG